LATLRRELYPADLPRDVVKGCFPVSAQMNFDFPKIAPGSSEERILSVLFDDRSEALEGSPFHHIAANRTPFYLACGEKDWPRIVRSNRQMARALRAIGCDVRLNIFRGRDHFD